MGATNLAAEFRGSCWSTYMSPPLAHCLPLVNTPGVANGLSLTRRGDAPVVIIAKLALSWTLACVKSDGGQLGH